MTIVRLVVQQHATPAVPTAPNAQISSDIGEEVRQATQAAIEGTRAAQAATGRGDIRVTRNGQTIVIPRPSVLGPGTAFSISTGAADFIPQQAVEMAWGFFAMLAVMVVGLPIARAYGRRIDRRGDVSAPSPALSTQLVRIEQAIEAMSIEVERISESQRFMAKLQHGSSAERV